MVQYDYEVDLVWDKEPSELEYIGELDVKTRKKEGIPNFYKQDFNIYGWTNLSFDAPPVGINEIYHKRLFISDYENKKLDNRLYNSNTFL